MRNSLHDNRHQMQLILDLGATFPAWDEVLRRPNWRRFSSSITVDKVVGLQDFHELHVL